MTVIVCDTSERVMVADTAVVNAEATEIVYHTAKIVRGPDGCLAGVCGGNAACGRLLQWVEDGRRKKMTADMLEGGALLIMERDGTILIYDGMVRPDYVLGGWAAIGAGAGYARAAHFVGASPLDCVRAAIHVSPQCGGEPTVMYLEKHK